MPRKLSKEQLLRKRIRQVKRTLSEFSDKRSAEKVFYALSNAEANLRADIELVDPCLLAQLWPAGIPDSISILELVYLTSVTPELSDDLHEFEPSLIYSTFGMNLLGRAEVAIQSAELARAAKYINDVEAVAEHLAGEGKINKPKFWTAREIEESKHKRSVSNARRKSVSKSSRYKQAQGKHAVIGKYAEDVRSLLINYEQASDNAALLKHATNALDRMIYSPQDIQNLSPFEKELNALILALDVTYEGGLERDYLYKVVKKHLKTS